MEKSVPFPGLMESTSMAEELSEDWLENRIAALPGGSGGDNYSFFSYPDGAPLLGNLGLL
jgi:hypothetical protein